MKSRTTIAGLLLLLTAAIFSGCGAGAAEERTGSLLFTMNGEGFARDGFVSEDGWRVDFDHVYVTIEGPTGWQAVLETRHAGHPHGEIPEGSAHRALTGRFTRDLHQGDGPVEIGRVDGAPIGNYNQLNFNLVRGAAGGDGFVPVAEGASVVLIGRAVKDQRIVAFTIRLTEEIEYTACGPHHDNIGVVAEDGSGTVETTFHFDHIFGDAEEGPADTTDPEAINYIAIGFGPMAELADGDTLDVTQTDLQAMQVYDQFRDALKTIGHSGEGHCHF